MQKCTVYRPSICLTHRNSIKRVAWKVIYLLEREYKDLKHCGYARNDIIYPFVSPIFSIFLLECLVYNPAVITHTSDNHLILNQTIKNGDVPRLLSVLNAKL